MRPRETFGIVVAFVLLNRSVYAESSSPAVDFTRDVRPILSEYCFKCHGPDKQSREAGLRLDTRDGAVAELDGHFAIVPGKPDQSELIARITSADSATRMPPEEANQRLSPQQIAIVKKWIEGGAEYSTWWSFVTPERPKLPRVQDKSWSQNSIDAFVLSKLDQAGLEPSAAADRATLIRRVTLDLTGLPPSLEEVDAFMADRSPGAYQRVVNRLLQSPRYGERMASEWLDAARYADTNGYEVDNARSMAPWRDWVVQAFNRNLPFDQFTIEQLAGDLLPNATLSQKIATGFNRNHRLNFEAGTIPEEFRVEYVVDRVDTTATVWLGLTAVCARCHDHKYDPITQEEFYGLFAFFNNVPEVGNGGKEGNAAPVVQIPDARLQQQLVAVTTKLAEAEATVKNGAGKQIESLRKQQQKLQAAVRTTMIMQELEKPRDTFVLVRGQYDQPGKQVTTGVPSILPPLPSDAPRNRLGLARWLVDPSNPLTARVIVNRYWQMFFGKGLVKTTENFGSQGALPTHPKLLDWLAAEFIRTGWDVKALHRLIVTSATYRQSAIVRPNRIDPENRLLSRNVRLRLPAEMIRDQALAISGLLVERPGGAAIKPYQPQGLWKELSYGGKYTAQVYQQDHGDNLYRRSLYIFWKRTVPPPSMTVFDAPSRETCTVDRPRTNTPLQALALMNDTTYTEAARALAERMLTEGGPSRAQQVTFGYRLLLARPPKPQELKVLVDAFNRYLKVYRADPQSALELLQVGESLRDPSLDVSEHAAATVVGSLLLNLDKSICRE